MKNVLFISTIFGCLFFMGCAPTPPPFAPPPPPTLPVVEVVVGTATTFQEYPASIEGAVNVEVRPQVSGALEKVYVDEGAYVSEGTPLFKIIDLPYRAQLNNAEAALHAAEAALVNTQLEIDKVAPLVQNKVVSEFQLKSAKAAHQVALANIEQAKANVSSAEINLNYTVIKAPVSGYISRLAKKKGSLVSPQDIEPITLLSDIHEMHVYFALGEKDFVGFKKQNPGTTLTDKLKQIPPVSLLLADDSLYEQKGKIDMIDGQFNKNTGAITLRASFANPQGLLRSGNTGKVRLSIQHNKTLIVPQSATIETQDKIFVFAVADSNKVAKRPITVISKNGTDYLVQDGVKAGDRIVLNGVDRLQDGMVIVPEKAQPMQDKVEKK